MGDTQDGAEKDTKNTLRRTIPGVVYPVQCPQAGNNTNHIHFIQHHEMGYYCDEKVPGMLAANKKVSIY